jgi:hypothetical protein
MRVCIYISGFSLLFTFPNVIKYGNFSHNQANLNVTMAFLVIAAVLFLVNSITSKMNG